MPVYQRLLHTTLLGAAFLQGAGDSPAAPPATTAVAPAALGSFTRAIQPLLLNRCATGACHGGPQAAEPRLQRGPLHGRTDRTTTLANLQQVIKAVADSGGSDAFLRQVLTGHDALPRRPSRPSRTDDQVLSSRERQLLEAWLTLSLPPTTSGSASPVSRPASVQPAGFEAPLAAAPQPATPNQFRRLLEQAANPPQLPPPRATKGLNLDTLLPDDFPPLPPVATEPAEKPND